MRREMGGCGGVVARWLVHWIPDLEIQVQAMAGLVVHS